MSQSKQPLSGVTILDFTRVLAGPFATMLLGDLGATVIKVEPLAGDESRTWPPILPKGESGYFAVLNRNKLSLAINLKDPRGKDIALGMARQADVVMENFTPGVVRKLGINYDALAAVNPSLIFCSISGFGQNGPYRDKKAYDPIIQGMTGLMSITGERGRSPVKVGIPITDLIGANNAVMAILAAYIHRMKTGEGQFIDVALYDGMIAFLTIMAMDYFASGKAPEPWGLDHIHRVPARAFEAADGKYVQVAATSDVMFARFCDCLDLGHLKTDPRCRDNATRVRYREVLMPLFEAKMKEKTRKDWLALFESQGIPCGPILDIAEVFADANISARNLTMTVDHPLEGSLNLLGFPFQLSRTPLTVRHRPPLLGEHSRQILGERLGYSEERITNLIKDGAIGEPTLS